MLNMWKNYPKIRDFNTKLSFKKFYLKKLYYICILNT